MSPYRTTPVSDRTPDALDNISDDHILGVVLFVVGALRVVIALARHEVFESEATFALMMVSAGAVLLFRRR